MQIFPQQNFTIVRQIADHTDVATYYVRAVVRNAFTDEIIATLDLDSKGSQRYKKDWQVPVDRFGQGTWISIVTSVYEDSGHTTKSSLYGDEEATHVILARESSFGKGGGGSVGNGGSLSLRDIKDAVREIIIENKVKIPKPQKIEFPEQEKYEMRWDEVLSALNAVKEAVSKIPTEQVDLIDVLDGIKRTEEGIQGINIPELDLSPILSEMKKDRKQNSIQNERIITMMKKFISGLPENMTKIFKKVFNEANFITSSVTFIGDKKPMMHKLELGEETLKPKEKINEFNFSELSK